MSPVLPIGRIAHLGGARDLLHCGISPRRRRALGDTLRHWRVCYDREVLERMEVIMTYESRLLAGILLIVLPTVMIGGVSILSLLIGDPAALETPLRQNLWRAGHAHAGVWLILALVSLHYVDEADLSNVMKWFVRGSIPIAAILVPAAFFLSVLLPDARTGPRGGLAAARPSPARAGGQLRALSTRPGPPTPVS